MMKMARNICHVAVPYQVQQELDGLQRSEDANVRFQAREALRLIYTFEAHLFSQSLSAYFADLDTLKGTFVRFFFIKFTNT